MKSKIIKPICTLVLALAMVASLVLGFMPATANAATTQSEIDALK